jgi:hypothetical protein
VDSCRMHDLRVREAKDTLDVGRSEGLGHEHDIVVERPSHRAEVLEDVRLLEHETAGDDVLDVVLGHLLVVPQQVQRLLALDLLHHVGLLLHVALEQVLFVVYAGSVVSEIKSTGKAALDRWIVGSSDRRITASLPCRRWITRAHL